MSEPEFLFHYSDFQGFMGIIREGLIKISQANAWKSKTGVYLTSIPPESTTMSILLNNFDCGINGNSFNEGYVMKNNLIGRAKFCFQIKKTFIPKAVKISEEGDGRDNWVNPDNIMLNSWDVRACQREYTNSLEGLKNPIENITYHIIPWRG